MVGRKVIYLAGYSVFILGAGVAAVSTELLVVIACRLLQGAGAAMIQTTGMAIIVTSAPAGDRGRVIGMFMTMVGLGAVMGPIVGGAVVDEFGWRGVFVLSIPLGLASLAGAAFTLHRDPSTVRGLGRLTTGFDWPGAVASAASAATFLLVMTNIYRLGWTSPITVSALSVAIGLLLAFIFWERRCAEPVLDLDLFRSRTFALGSFASFFGFLAGTSVFSMMPFFLVDVLGLSARSAGMFIAPAALGFAAAGPLSGRLADRFGARPIEFIGLGIIASSLTLLVGLTPDTSPWTVALALTMQGFGMGIYYTPNTTSVLSVVDQHRYGVATAFLNMARYIASVAGVGIATSIATITMAANGFEPSLDAVSAGGAGVESAFVSGLRIAFLTLGAFIAVSIVLTALKPSGREDAAAPATVP